LALLMQNAHREEAKLLHSLSLGPIGTLVPGHSNALSMKVPTLAT
jgi:hypothetical protein